MPGSLRDWRYVADDGEVYAVRADESNVRLLHPAADLAVTGVGLLKRPPQNVKIRYAILKDATNLRTRKVPVLTQDTFNALNANTDYVTDNTTQGADPNPGATFNLATKFPERVRLVPKLLDTGLNDGTQP